MTLYTIGSDARQGEGREGGRDGPGWVLVGIICVCLRGISGLGFNYGHVCTDRWLCNHSRSPWQQCEIS